METTLVKIEINKIAILSINKYRKNSVMEVFTKHIAV